DTVRLGIVVNLAAAAVALAGLPAPRPRALVAALPAVAILGLAAPSWSQQVMTSGVAVYAPLLESQGPEAPGEVVLYKDGRTCTVSVHRLDEVLYLRVNGKTDASNTRSDMATQLMLGHL